MDGVYQMLSVCQPREFISVYIVAVYVLTNANLENALQELYDVISSNMSLLCSNNESSSIP